VKWWRDRRKAREDAVLAVLFEQQRQFERNESAGRWVHVKHLSTRARLDDAQTVGALSRLQLEGFIQTDGAGFWRFNVPPAEPPVTRSYRIRCGECGSDWVQVEWMNAWEWHEAGCRSGRWLVEARSQQVMTYGYD